MKKFLLYIVLCVVLVSFVSAEDVFLEIDDVNFMFRSFGLFDNELAFCFVEFQDGFFVLRSVRLDGVGVSWVRFECLGDLAVHSHPNGFAGFSDSDFVYHRSNSWRLQGVVVSDKVLLADKFGNFWVLV